MKQRRLVLIFGVRGYLGRNLFAELNRRNINTAGVARSHIDNESSYITLDSRIKSRIDSYISKNHIEGVDICILLGSSRERKDREIHQSNFVINKKIVDLSTKLPDPKIVYVGGLGIPSKNIKSSETYYYSKGKIIEYIENLDLESKTILNPSYIVGKSDEFSHLIEQFRNTSTIFYPGDGDYIIQPVYIDDFVNLLCSVIQTTDKTWNGSWNIAGEPITYRRFLETIRDGVVPSARVLSKPVVDYLRNSLFSDRLEFSSSELSILLANFMVPHTKEVNGINFRPWREVQKLLIQDYSERADIE